DISKDLENLEIENNIIKFSINLERILGIKTELEKEIPNKLNEISALESSIKENNETIEKINSELSEPFQKYNTYLETLKTWDVKKKQLEGDELIPDSLHGIQHQITMYNN